MEKQRGSARECGTITEEPTLGQEPYVRYIATACSISAEGCWFLGARQVAPGNNSAQCSPELL